MKRTIIGLEVYTWVIDNFGFDDYFNGNYYPLLLLQFSQYATFSSLDQWALVWLYLSNALADKFILWDFFNAHKKQKILLFFSRHLFFSFN